MLSTLGYDRYFCVYINKRGEIVLQNSSDIRVTMLDKKTKKSKGKILSESDFEEAKKQYANFVPEEKYKSKYYTDSKSSFEIQRHHGPLIPALFRFVCENGYCVLGTCGNKKCLK